MKSRILTLSLALMAAVAAPAISAEAQEAHQWQFSLVLGHNNTFNQNTAAYLTPEYSTSSQPGLGLGSGSQMSKDPGYYLNLGELGNNSLVNMLGIQTRFFLSEKLSLNALFAMDLANTPAKNYEEGYDGDGYAIPASRYIEGRLATNMIGQIGVNWHFKTSNEHIGLYTGLQVGGQFGRVRTTRPYTGDDDKDIFLPEKNAGQIWTLSGYLVGGVEYEFVKGFLLGFEVAPAAYHHSQVELHPEYSDDYIAKNQTFRFFANPQLKISFRF
ncbi:MAG: hypothetical protein II375_04800 [Bacteroidales bacterium]|nr:hypothetical protein [Bacteroidales bacterium]